MIDRSKNKSKKGSEPQKERDEGTEEDSWVEFFVRPPAIRPPPPWKAHKQSPSFEAAVAKGLLFDVTELSRPYGQLSVTVFLDKELKEDIEARLPGELGGLTPESRREVVVAQTTALLSRSVDAINNDDSVTFAKAVSEQYEIGFDLKLALIADIAKERPRSQGTHIWDDRDRQEPYTLYLSLEYDQKGNYGLVLALQSPFSPQEKSGKRQIT